MVAMQEESPAELGQREPAARALVATLFVAEWQQKAGGDTGRLDDSDKATRP